MLLMDRPFKMLVDKAVPAQEYSKEMRNALFYYIVRKTKDRSGGTSDQDALGQESSSDSAAPAGSSGAAAQPAAAPAAVAST